MSEARERGGRNVGSHREYALELRAHQGELSEARERGGRNVGSHRGYALELRAHREEK
jgi:hypothetical protein